MPRTRIFTARDRRPLTAVLTAGLRHTDIDQIIQAHPVPGDPGHDAGKAGRVGLLTATLLAGTDHTGLAQALAMTDATKVTAAGHDLTLERLRIKAGALPDAPPPRTAPAADRKPETAPHPEDVVELDDTRAVELDDTPAPQDQPQASPSLPVILLEGLEMDHPLVDVLLGVGVQVLPSADLAPEGHLVLSAAAPTEEHRRPGRDIRAPSGPSA